VVGNPGAEYDSTHGSGGGSGGAGLANNSQPAPAGGGGLYGAGGGGGGSSSGLASSPGGGGGPGRQGLIVITYTPFIPVQFVKFWGSQDRFDTEIVST
jgi:hypothetical protein